MTRERQHVARAVARAQRAQLSMPMLGAELIAAGRALIEGSDVGLARQVTFAEIADALRSAASRGPQFRT
jgi:hypothetical protein